MFGFPVDHNDLISRIDRARPHEEQKRTFSAIPDDPELAVDLTAPGYDAARGKRFHGSIQLEDKDDLKVRGEASPDDGDTLAMTFAVKVAAKPRPQVNLRYSYPEQNELSWLA